MPESIASAFAEAFQRYKRRRAIAGSGGVSTYQDLSCTTAAISRALSDISQLGIPRPSVCVVLGNGPDYIAALTATLLNGFDAAPLDPRLGSDELREAIGQLRPGFALVQPGSSLRSREFSSYWAESRSLTRECDLLIAARRPADGGAQPGSSPALVFHTSGTSGRPKLIRHSAESALAAIRPIQMLRGQAIAQAPFEPGRLARVISRTGASLMVSAMKRTTVMTTFAFSGIGGHTLMATCLLNGDTLVIPQSLYPNHMLADIGRYRAAMLATTPAILRLMLKAFEPAKHDISALRLIGLGGGPVAAELIDTARRELSCEVLVSYGTTELGGSVLCTRAGDPMMPTGTVGRTLPGVSVRIIDDSGRVVPDGRPGELVCQTVGGWVRTGDLAVRGHDGNVRVLGRLDDMLLRDGMNIYPAEVELVLDAHQDVVRSAVLPVAGPGGDTRVRALVVPREGSALTAADIIAHCRDRLAAYRVPDEVHFVARLPQTPDGDIRSPYLRRRALQGLQPDLAGS